jgi:hypothetical protein
VCPGWA